MKCFGPKHCMVATASRAMQPCVAAKRKDREVRQLFMEDIAAYKRMRAQHHDMMLADSVASGHELAAFVASGDEGGPEAARAAVFSRENARLARIAYRLARRQSEEARRRADEAMRQAELTEEAQLTFDEAGRLARRVTASAQGVCAAAQAVAQEFFEAHNSGAFD